LVEERAFLVLDENALAVLDLSRPQSPRLLNRHSTEGPVIALDVGKSMAALLIEPNRLLLLDVSQPVTLREIGRYTLPDEGRGLSLSGETAWVATRSGLAAVDIRNPKHPRGMGQAGHGVTESSGPLLVHRGYAYVAGRAGLTVFDVRNPSRLRRVGRVPAMMVCDLALHDSRLCVAMANVGLVIFDLTDPAHPTQVGDQKFVWTYSMALWRNYAVLCADPLSLYVVNLKEPRQPSVEGYVPMTAMVKQIQIATPFVHTWLAEGEHTRLLVWSWPELLQKPPTNPASDTRR